MQSNANGDAGRAHMQRTCLARANAPDFFAYLYKVKRARAHAQPSAGVSEYRERRCPSTAPLAR